MGNNLPPTERSPLFECNNAADIFTGKAPMPMSLHGQDMCFLEGLALRFKFLGNMKTKNPDNWKQLRLLQRAMSYNIWDSTYAVMSDKYWDGMRPGSGSSQERQAERKIQFERTEIKNSFNRKYQTF
jgi:hypothetical protein